MAVVEFDFAGYSDDKGRLGKTIPPGRILIPGAIWLENDVLNWHLGPNRDFPLKSYVPPKRLLNDFVGLWRAPDDRILAYAKRFGVLWENRGSVEGQEPLFRWRLLSWKLSRLLTVGAELAAGRKRITREAWRYIDTFDERRLNALENPAEARSELARRAEGWVYDCGFSVRWNSKQRRFELEIDYRSSMLNAVGLQFALTVSNSDSLYICSGCGLPYPRRSEKRRPKAGQANFCDECGNAAALRQADVRRKEKMAEARRLSAEGVLLNEIAERLKTKPASVRRWLKKGR
jgi:hypothetical protein